METLHSKEISKKFAFCILAHTDPEQLKRLVYSLDFPMFDIYICVDKKQDISVFHFEEYHLKYSELTVLDDREKIYWGDISIVSATIKMYRAAIKRQPYARLITLSGQDYPICSNAHIYRALSDENVEYIMGEPIYGRDFFKVQQHFFWRLPVLGKVLRKIVMCLNIKTKKNYLQLKSGEKLTIYFAPQWHALSYSCIDMILQQLDSHAEIWQYFKYSYAPDELLIPTLLFNSKFKDHALRSSFPENTHYNQKSTIHYLNYEPVIEVFDEAKYDAIVSSGKLFFRKAVSGKSDKLIEKINRYRQQDQIKATGSTQQ